MVQDIFSKPIWCQIWSQIGWVRVPEPARSLFFLEGFSDCMFPIETTQCLCAGDTESRWRSGRAGGVRGQLQPHTGASQSPHTHTSKIAIPQLRGDKDPGFKHDDLLGVASIGGLEFIPQGGFAGSVRLYNPKRSRCRVEHG